MKRLLLISDGSGGRDLARRLRPLGFEVELESDISAAELADQRTDMVLLNGDYGNRNATDSVREIRRHATVPLLVLSGSEHLTERIVALELGADDFLPQDVDDMELVARIKAIFRREQFVLQRSTETDVLEAGDVQLHVASREAVRGGERLELTPVEFDLLRLLLASAGSLVTRDTIAREVFSRRTGSRTRAIDVHMSGLRKKLGPGHQGSARIRTIRGYGYIYANGDAG